MLEKYHPEEEAAAVGGLELNHTALEVSKGHRKVKAGRSLFPSKNFLPSFFVRVFTAVSSGSDNKILL